MKKDNYKNQTDEQLILLIQSKDDRSAFDELAERYRDNVMQYVYQWTKNIEDAEDITQECFIKIFRYRDKYNSDKAGFSTWMWTIVNNTIKTHHRLQKETEEIEFNETREVEKYPEEEFEEDDYEDRDEVRFKWEQVQKAMEHLEEEYKQCILLRYMEELEYDKIAEILGIPVGTVKSRISRGRERLRKIILEYYNE